MDDRDRSQIDRSKEAAHEFETDEDEEWFNKKLRKRAKQELDDDKSDN